MQAPRPKCKFFEAGFCAKGQYCEYSHDSIGTECIYFKEGTCKYGSSCAFIHSLRLKAPKQPVKNPGDNLVMSFSALAVDETAAVMEPRQQQQAFEENVWGFCDDSRDQGGVYFYGAPGTFPSDSVPRQPAIRKYADVLGSDKALQAEIKPVQNAQKKKPLCPFFISGNCKFGRTCRNSHEKIDTFSESATEKTENLECGICMGNPPDGLYGLLNNCGCVFCLSCIREWRRDGLTVALDGDKVRLCPLCRVESHYVCPSTRILRGPEKDAFVDVYRESLASKPCKFYQDDGVCPFGTSCFYLHISRDGTLESELGGGTAAPRIIVNERGEAESSRRRVTVADLVTSKLRK